MPSPCPPRHDTRPAARARAPVRALRPRRVRFALDRVNRVNRAHRAAPVRAGQPPQEIKVRVFDSVRELRSYCKRTGKFYPREQAKAEGLRMFLRKMF